MDFSIESVFRIFDNFSPDLCPEETKNQLVSTSFFSKASHSVLENSKAVRIIKSIRSFSNKPIFLIPQPRPMKWASEGSIKKTEVFRKIDKSSCKDYLSEVYAETIDLIKTKYNVTLITQPQDTIENKIFTKNMYGLADLNNKNENSLFTRGDHFHANELYANVIWQELKKQKSIFS
jgi:hypothetical protein